MKRHLSLLLLVMLGLTLQASNVITTRQLSLDDSGQTLCTIPLQRAIDQLAGQGGGTLVFTQGSYLSGALQLRSNITLLFHEGASLLGSKNPRDYQKVDVDADEKGREDNGCMALLVAEGQRNIQIKGHGTIDGQGLSLALNADSLFHTGELPDAHYNWRRLRPSELVRPKLFFFYQCSNVTVADMRLRNSANWGLSFDRCEGMTLKNLDIENRAYWNNDGIDLTDCKHVVVTGCRINSADDGICLKSYQTTTPSCRHCADTTFSSHDIVISNCDIRSSASAVKFGTASWGGFARVDISHIRVTDTFRSAVAIESVDGAQVEDINISHVDARNTGNALFMRLGRRGGDRPGSLRNVTVSHLYCEVPFGRPDEAYDLRGPEVDFFHNPFPSSICGIPGNRIENVRLQHIEIRYPGRATRGMAYMPLWRVRDVPEQESKYPEFSMFGELPAWGFYVRHVKGITLSDVKLTLEADDFRPAFVFDDVEEIQMQRVEPNDDKQLFIAPQ